MGTSQSHSENRKLTSKLAEIGCIDRTSFTIRIPDDINSYEIIYMDDKYIAIAKIRVSTPVIKIKYKLCHYCKIKFFDDGIKDFFSGIKISRGIFKNTYTFSDRNTMEDILGVLLQYLNKTA